jgi:hypothetical protein
MEASWTDEKETPAPEIRVFEQWAIVELYGHVKLAGRVTEEDVFGRTLGRIDVPLADGGWVTQYFGGGSIYRLTPCSEAAARQVAQSVAAPRIYQLELTPPKPTVVSHTFVRDEDGDCSVCGQDPGSLVHDDEDDDDFGGEF